jgi:response regulator of citrate/malate metabolism
MHTKPNWMVLIMKVLTVLIVAENTKLADVHKSIVEVVDGFAVMGIVTKRSEVADLLQRNKPDLVIFDDNLAADLNGIEVAAFVQKKQLPIDFILVTEVNDCLSITRALRLGIVDYILKPVQLKRLVSSLVSYREFRGLLFHKRILSQAEISQRWQKPQLLLRSGESHSLGFHY